MEAPAIHDGDGLTGLIEHAIGAGEGSKDSVLNRLLHAARTHLGMEVAFISEFKDGSRVFRHVDTDLSDPPLGVGDSAPLDQSYCKKVVDGDLPELIPNAQELSEARKIDGRIGAHISVPIRLSDGSVFGTFCSFAFSPDYDLNDRDHALIKVLADLTASVVEREAANDRERLTKRRRIKAVLRDDAVSTVWQPIVDIATRKVVGLETLSRFPADGGRTPAHWFAEATEVGLAAALETKSVENALAGIGDFPSPTYVSFNLSAKALGERGLIEKLQHHLLERAVLELTEHDIVEDYETLAREIAPLRERGLKLAVDDAGAGYASFRHILRLRPDIIKLDMSLVRDIDTDVSRRALAASFERFAHDMGISVVAEGVETEAELATLAGIGIEKAIPVAQADGSVRGMRHRAQDGSGERGIRYLLTRPVCSDRRHGAARPHMNSPRSGRRGQRPARTFAVRIAL